MLLPAALLLVALSTTGVAYADYGLELRAVADGGSDTVKISGKTAISNHIIITATDPNRALVYASQFPPMPDGTFQHDIKVGETWRTDGVYEIAASQVTAGTGANPYKMSVNVRVIDGMLFASDETASTFTPETGLRMESRAIEGAMEVTVYGTTDRIGEPITFSITAPDGTSSDGGAVEPEADGSFEVMILVDPDGIWSQDGTYVVSATQGNRITGVQVEIVDGVVVPEFGAVAVVLVAGVAAALVLSKTGARGRV